MDRKGKNEGSKECGTRYMVAANEDALTGEQNNHVDDNVFTATLSRSVHRRGRARQACGSLRDGPGQQAAARMTHRNAKCAGTGQFTDSSVDDPDHLPMPYAMAIS